MRHLFDRPLGNSLPNGFLFKRDVYSLIGSVVGAGGQMATNQVNAERAASDMATYLNLVRKQRDWQKEDQRWSADMIRKSVGLQMQGYEDAGLNPYAAVSNGQITSGQSYSPGSRSSVSPMQRPPLENPLQGVSDKIFGASAVKSQRIASLAEFAKTIPDLVKGLGKDAALRVVSSAFGNQNVDMNLVQGIVQNEALQSDFKTQRDAIETRIASVYGEKEASNRVALQEQSFNKMAAEIGLMSSEGKVNDAKVYELMSSYVRNLADAWKLRKEGDYYVANAQTVNDIRDLTIGSLKAELTKSNFENRIKGYYQGSQLDNYLSTDYHSQKSKDVVRIQENAEGSELVKAFDRVFGKYLKVSSAM